MKLNPLRLRTRLALGFLRNRCEREGHDEHVALIDEALEGGDEVLDAIALGTEEMRIGPDEIYLGGGFREGGRLIEILDWFLANGPAILEFIAKILVLFGKRAAPQVQHVHHAQTTRSRQGRFQNAFIRLIRRRDRPRSTARRPPRGRRVRLIE